MGTVTLLLGIHNHQPQGNFDHVFAQGYEDCYRRLLEAIVEHKTLRITLHYSGPLIEWLETHHPEYFDTLAELVESGRVELMGGGFYEPMLSVLPERDALGQLGMMADFLQGRVGRRPRGMWLAERVWEPDLCRVIAAAGYRYTIVDDGHFLAAGMKRPLRGFYITDKAGIPLCLFPISMELRYTIPFKPAPEAIDLLHRIAEEAGEGDLVVTYGDDGEKFGLWPDTKSWVWDQRWLDQFLDGIEEHSDTIRTATFSEVLQRQSPRGRVYLPTASYDEMGEWALPAEAQERFHALTHAVEDQGRKEEWGPFVRGGIWQGFLAKYAESNFMHKRMCHVSARVARAAESLSRPGADPSAAKLVDAATRELYRGQCNCAYWHGLFGGLYLAKLRSAVHSHLIRADVEASRALGAPQRVELVREDIDGDLLDEVVLSGREIGIIVSPARGGAVLCIDDRERMFCISDVLTRRREAYHAKVRALSGAADTTSAEAAPKSIHEIARLKDEGLADLLLYDPHQRVAFVDQFFPADMGLDALWRCQAPERGDFVDGRYDLLQAAGGTGHLLLGRTGVVQGPSGPVEVCVHKSFHVDERSLVVDYEISAAEPLREMLFATELSLALPSGPHPEGRCLIYSHNQTDAQPVTSTGTSREVQRLELKGAHASMTIALKLTPGATLVRFPLETASQSESGFERTYQGTTLVWLWPVDLVPSRPMKASLKLELA